MNRMIKEQFEIDKNNRLVKYHEKEGITDVVIPDFITGILGQAFLDCNNIISVTIPKNIREILDFTFLGCKNLKHVIFNEGLKKIGNYAFTSCKNLTDINLPSTLESIGCSAFKFCESLQKIIISKNVDDLCPFTFLGCKSLVSITIPNSVTKISFDVFRDCNNIKTINIFSYKVFSLLDNDLKVIALNTIIKNKIKFSEEEINKFSEYIIENKIEILKCIIKNSYLKNLLIFMLNDIYMFYTEEEINSILNEMNNQIDIETKAMLLKYSDKIRNTSISPLDKFDLGDFEEDLGKKTM